MVAISCQSLKRCGRVCCTRGFAAQQKPERKGRTIRGGMLRAVSVERRETDRTSYTPVLITVAVDTRSASHSDIPPPFLPLPPSFLFDSDVYPPKAQLSGMTGMNQPQGTPPPRLQAVPVSSRFVNGGFRFVLGPKSGQLALRSVCNFVKNS